MNMHKHARVPSAGRCGKARQLNDTSSCGVCKQCRGYLIDFSLCLLRVVNAPHCWSIKHGNRNELFQFDLSSLRSSRAQRCAKIPTRSCSTSAGSPAQTPQTARDTTDKHWQDFMRVSLFLRRGSCGWNLFSQSRPSRGSSCQATAPS